jgi:hypothetical protein
MGAGQLASPSPVDHICALYPLSVKWRYFSLLDVTECHFESVPTNAIHAYNSKYLSTCRNAPGLWLVMLFFFCLSYLKFEKDILKYFHMMD